MPGSYQVPPVGPGQQGTIVRQRQGGQVHAERAVAIRRDPHHQHGDRVTSETLSKINGVQVTAILIELH